MINIVIADDEPLALIELKSLIPWNDLGYNIIGEFRNGKSALDFILDHSETDIAILDINMPAMSGLQVIEERNRIDKPIEYLVVSAYSDYSLVRKAFKLGISDYIIKEELEPENLLPVLEKIAGRINRKKVTSMEETPIAESKGKKRILDYLKGEASLPDDSLLNDETVSPLLIKLEILSCRKDHKSVQNEALICYIEDSAGKSCKGAVCLEEDNVFFLILPYDKGNPPPEETYPKLSRSIKNGIRKYFNKLLIFSTVENLPAEKDLPDQYMELKSLHGFRSRSIRRCLEYIQEHYQDDEISFDDLCRITETSRSYLSSLFKQETGIGYKDYLNEVRISHAISLLEKTEMKVQEISEQVGFSNVEHFSRTFKSRTGISPSRYSREKG